MTDSLDKNFQDIFGTESRSLYLIDAVGLTLREGWVSQGNGFVKNVEQINPARFDFLGLLNK